MSYIVPNMDKSEDQPDSAEAITRKMTCYGLFAVPATILSLVLLAAIILLGSKGIENECFNSTVINVAVHTAQTLRDGNALSPADSVDRELELPGTNAYLVWVAWASGCGLLWTFLTLLAIWLLLEFLVRYHYLEYEKRKEPVIQKNNSNNENKKPKTASSNKEEPSNVEPTLEGGHDEVDAGEDVDAGQAFMVRQPAVDKPDENQAENPDQGVVQGGLKIWNRVQSIRRALTEDPQTWGETHKGRVALPDEGDIKKAIDTVGKYVVQEWKTTGLRSLTLQALVGLFFSLFFFMAALTCLLFGVAITANRACHIESSVNFFLTVGTLVAVVMPLCLFVCLVLLATLIEFITLGHIDIRQVIPAFMPAVKFKEGKNNDYWVIQDRFYFLMEKRNKHLEKDYWYSFQLSWPTWFLIVVMLTSIHLALSYFVDTTVVTQVTAVGCSDPRLDNRFDCFEPGTLEHINCTEPDEVTELLHCYRFHRFGVDDNLVLAGSTAFAFYLATMAIFGQVFSVVKIILYIKPGKLWGFGFFTIGVLGIVATFVLFGFWVSGFSSDTFAVLLQLPIINLVQILMVCIFVTMIGLLLTVGKWWERGEKIIPRGIQHTDGHTGDQTKKLEEDIKEEGNEEAPQEGIANTRL